MARLSGASVWRPTMISLSLVDVARLVRADRRGDLADIEHALLAFGLEEVGERVPEPGGPLRWGLRGTSRRRCREW
jgi:hypothetical protein